MFLFRECRVEGQFLKPPLFWSFRGLKTPKKGWFEKLGAGGYLKAPLFWNFQPPKTPKKGWFEKLAGFEPCTRWPSPMPGPLGHRSQTHCVMCASLFKTSDPSAPGTARFLKPPPFWNFQPPKTPKKGWFEKLAGFEPCTRWPSPMPGPLGHRRQMHCVMCASLFKPSDPSAPGTARFLKPPPFWNFQPPKTPKNGWFEKLAGLQPCTQAQCQVR